MEGSPRAGNASAVLPRLAQGLARAGVAPGDGLVVAVSGGPDSMVLLDALCRLRRRVPLALHVAHVHHGLRGAAADRDAALVQREARVRGVPVQVAQLAPTERPRGTSVEMWARDARYRALEAARREAGASWIATAHTADDQAETLLLHLLRGTGPRGLAGIPDRRAAVVRPLLAVRRRDVEAYAAAHGVRFRRDASNADEAHLRNRVRRRVLPALARAFNPRLVESLADLARLQAEDDATLQAEAEALRARIARADASGVVLEVAPLAAAPAAIRRRVIQQAYREQAGGAGLTRRHAGAVERLLLGPGRLALPGGRRAWREGRLLRLGAVPAAGQAPAPGEIAIPVGAWTTWAAAGCRIRLRPVARPQRRAGDRCRALLDPAVLGGEVGLRGWRPGDRFRPLGLGGEKKLQDFFTDAKVPRGERARVPLLLAGGRIAWVVGYRVAEEFRWTGQGPACLAEVRFDRERRAVPVGPGTDQRR